MPRLRTDVTSQYGTEPPGLELGGKVAIVTGAGGGIGAALVAALSQAGVQVLAADVDADRVRAAVAHLSPTEAIAMPADATDAADLGRLIETAERELGPVDLFFANAGVAIGTDLGSSDEEWSASIDVNLMAHVRAARLLVPRWIERGGGYFVSTASAAGLLTQIGSAQYATTKHAAVGFAEWLSVTYGDRGVGVSCLCPMGVRTPMLDTGFDAAGEGEAAAVRAVRSAGTVLEPDDVARMTLDAVRDRRFLVLPHPEVLDFYRQKGADYDRWLRGMRRMQRDVETSGAAADPASTPGRPADPAAAVRRGAVR